MNCGAGLFRYVYQLLFSFAFGTIANNTMTIYSFRQNNSFGYYFKPAKYILVKDARDSEHAFEIGLAAGMYVNGVADGSDCSCCGDRWYDYATKFATLEDALLNITNEDELMDSMESDGIPHYIVVDDLDVLDTVLE